MAKMKKTILSIIISSEIERSNVISVRVFNSEYSSFGYYFCISDSRM